MTDGRDFDVVLFGATGFVGRLVAGYLAEHAPPGTRVALAGRSTERLAAVRAELPAAAAGWPLLAADAREPAALAAMAGTTRVVATTVGPYATYGLPLVEACARAGTHYADLTGEVLFVRDSIDRFDAVAREAGARIVHSCGFDSIPSDLGVLLVHEAAAADGAGGLEDTTLAVTALRGGLSGGTLASVLGQLDEVRADPARRRVAADPYALSPDRTAEPELGGESDLALMRYDDVSRRWVAPFLMASYNTRVVRRSNALLGHAYGRRFRYREVTATGDGVPGAAKAALVTGGLAAGFVALSVPVLRPVLGRVLPAPGEGPSERTRREGLFRMEIDARTESGTRYVAFVAAKGDPGYAATAVMLGESALCLANDSGRLPFRAGVLTPATAMGDALVDRLRAAGFTFDVRRA